MLKQVLKSIEDMLVQSLKSQSPGEAKIYVTCAKSLLVQVLNGMQSNASVDTIPKTQAKPQLPPEPKYAIEAENGKLKKITMENGDELDADAMVALNGKAMSYKEAKGKPFQTGQVL